MRFYKYRGFDFTVLYNVKFGKYVNIDDSIRFRNAEQCGSYKDRNKWEVYPLGYDRRGVNRTYYKYDSEIDDWQLVIPNL